jgi:hypothetical protein
MAGKGRNHLTLFLDRKDVRHISLLSRCLTLIVPHKVGSVENSLDFAVQKVCFYP